MKQMIVEKLLDLSSNIDEVVDLHVLNEIYYNAEADGIRALGSLDVQGQYLDQGLLKDLHEIITLDVLAPFEKIKEDDSFKIVLHHYDYRIEDRSLIMSIVLSVYGIVEDAIQDEQMFQDDDLMYEPIQEELPEPEPFIMPLKEEVEEPVIQKAAVPEEPLAAAAAVEETTAVAEENAQLEDLFDDAENVVVSKRYIVCTQSDSYASLAKRYNVNETLLMQLNNNKTIQNRTLIALPL